MGNSHPRKLSTKYESLDYDLVENIIFLEHEHKSNLNKFLRRDLQRWLAIFIIAFGTAMSGFFASIAVKWLTSIKYSNILDAAESRCPQANSTDEPLTIQQTFDCMISPYLTWALWNILPSLFGSILVTYIAPVAAGSGIPVVKCYLNGVNIPEVVRFRTYIVKLVGVVASVVGGLAVGKEGPFIHCGAALGADLSQGKSTTLNIDTGLFKSFRNDRDKRDFVSAGASAGVAAAFGSPIGGVLFALEEGASFWNQALTWRIFFCSMMTSFILNLLMVAFNHNTGILAFYSLVNFGLVEELDYFWFEIPIYICIAVSGGIIGASFCYFNLIITRIRKKYLRQRWMKIVDTLFIAILSASLACLLIIFATECRPLPPEKNLHITNSSRVTELSNNIIKNKPTNIFDGFFKFWQNNPGGANSSRKNPFDYNPSNEMRKALDHHILTFMCPKGQYSAMSSLWLKTSEGASSTFMVLQEDIWSAKTLILFFIAYYMLAIVTYGLSISSGIFIPSLLIGATMGRIVGLALLYIFGPQEWLKQLNKFALIGAASTLGGVVRMTISLTVIIIEATGCISFGLPIMICLMVSKWVADTFIEGVYDLAIHMSNVPFLDWEPPSNSYSVYASDVMSHDVRALRTTETVANLIHILKSCPHNGFPVVDIDEKSMFGQLEGGDNFSRRPLQGDGSSEEDLSRQTSTGDYLTPQESPSSLSSRRRRPTASNSNLDDSRSTKSDTTDTKTLVNNEVLAEPLNDDYLIGSFQRCSVTPKRESYGRYRGVVLRWQVLVMLEMKIFNENERSFEHLCLPAFQESYPKYPKLEDVISGLDQSLYGCHVDFRSIMNPMAHTVSYSASFPRIYQLFRSLGLRHLVVVDDRNQVVGMITRKDLARYAKVRDEHGIMRLVELDYCTN